MPQLRGTTRACIVDFWLHVMDSDLDDHDSCWLWTGSCDGNGYPMYCGVGARRIAAVIDTGAIPGNVSMDCQTLRCVRPAHFFRIGRPGRKNTRSGKPTIRQDMDMQKRVYQYRHLSDEELAIFLNTHKSIVKSLRLSIPLYRIQEEVEYRKEHRMSILHSPMSQTLDFKG